MAKYSPAFQFYPADWLSSETVMLMKPAEEGAYIRLLALAWQDEDCTLPDDDKRLAVLSRLGKAWFRGASEKVRRKFIPHPNLPGRLYNERLMEERARQNIWRQNSAAGGIKSAKMKAEKSKILGNTENQAESTSSALDNHLAITSKCLSTSLPLPLPLPPSQNIIPDAADAALSGSSEPAKTKKRKSRISQTAAALRSNPKTPEFTAIWKILPPGMQKAQDYAWECWQKLNPDYDLQEKIADAVHKQKESREAWEEWNRENTRNPRFIPSWPNFSTWLNQGRWRDAIEFPPDRELTQAESSDELLRREDAERRAELTRFLGYDPLKGKPQ